MDFKLILHVLIGALLALIVWELAIKKVVVKSFDSENL